jgi:hypothetical protein
MNLLTHGTPLARKNAAQISGIRTLPRDLQCSEISVSED